MVTNETLLIMAAEVYRESIYNPMKPLADIIETRFPKLSTQDMLTVMDYYEKIIFSEEH